MTYVTEQTSAELRAHMRRLKGMKGWSEPLSDRLFKEVLELDAKVAALSAQAAQPVAVTDEQIDALLPADVFRTAECHKQRWRAFAQSVLHVANLAASQPVSSPSPASADKTEQERDAAILRAIDDVDEPGWTGYECPNTFKDGVWAARNAVVAAIASMAGQGGEHV